jgi:Family of unknown function (DUF5946)
MSHTCPDCGAIYPDDDTCQSIFESSLVLEYSNPDFGQVHFLTVACFMIQHERYSDDGLLWIYRTLSAYLDEGLTPEQLCRLAALDTQDGKRTWKVTREVGAPPLPRIAWSKTIADVALNYQDASSYRALVEAWARATAREMQGLIGLLQD